MVCATRALAQLLVLQRQVSSSYIHKNYRGYLSVLGFYEKDVKMTRQTLINVRGGAQVGTITVAGTASRGDGAQSSSAKRKKINPAPTGQLVPSPSLRSS